MAAIGVYHKVIYLVRDGRSPWNDDIIIKSVYTAKNLQNGLCSYSQVLLVNSQPMAS